MNQQELTELLGSWENLHLICGDRDKAFSLTPLLLDVALRDKGDHSWRAAYVLDKINESLPGSADAWVKDLIDALPGLVHPGKKRQFLKLISMSRLPERQMGFLLDYCAERLAAQRESISVKAYAMQILYNISEKEPGFKPELIEILSHAILFHPEPGVVAKGRKLVSKLQKDLHRKKKNY